MRNTACKYVVTMATIMYALWIPPVSSAEQEVGETTQGKDKTIWVVKPSQEDIPVSTNIGGAPPQRRFSNLRNGTPTQTVGSYAFEVYKYNVVDDLIKGAEGRIKDSLKKEVADATTKEVNGRLTDETKKVLQEDMIDKLAAQIAARLAAQFDEKLLGLEQRMKALDKQVQEMKRQ